jgi:hypothetical protein
LWFLLLDDLRPFSFRLEGRNGNAVMVVIFKVYNVLYVSMFNISLSLSIYVL